MRLFVEENISAGGEIIGVRGILVAIHSSVSSTNLPATG